MITNALCISYYENSLMQLMSILFCIPKHLADILSVCIVYYTSIYIEYYGKLTEYGQYPNTDILGISETINLTNKIVMNKIFIIIYIV